MNINVQNFVNSQSVNFKSAKTRALRTFKPRTYINNNTLKDVFDLKKKNQIVQNEYIAASSYQNYLKECEELEQRAASKKKFDSSISIMKAVALQAEYEKKTCKTFFAELAKYQKGVYNKLISRCFNDMEDAILKNAPQSEIDKLAQTTELFINKYSHYDIPLK